MTDTLFNDCLTTLGKIHADMPDLRFGEVIQNAIDGSLCMKNIHLCNVSTKQLKTSLEMYHVREKKKRGIE